MKKIFGMLLILCVFVCTLAFTFSVDAADGVLAMDDEGYYKIEDTADLDALASGTLWQTAGNKFKLYSDLTYTDAWTGPKFGSSCFNGTFDGNDYTITYTMSGSGRGALFTQAGKGAKILNLTVDATIESTAAADIGAIVAIGLGDLTIENCTVNGSIIGKQNVGGVIGRWRAAESDAEACSDGTTTLYVSATVNASVEGSNGRTGGMIGYINYHKGSYDVDIDVLGEVNGVVSGTEYVGGAVGYLLVASTVTAAHEGTIDIDVNVNADANAGDSDKVSGTSSRAGGLAGCAEFKHTAGTITFNAKGANYKKVAGTTNAGGAIGNVQISNPGGTVNILANFNNSGEISGTGAIGGIVGLLYADANSSGEVVVDIKAVNEEAATVTGSGDNVGGIIGKLDIRGSGKKTVTVSADNSADVKASGKNNVGGIVGRLSFDSSGDTAAYTENRTVTLQDCTNSGAIEANIQLGGIVGAALINGSYVTKGAFSFDNCKNTGTVTASGTNGIAGGVLGYALIQSTADGNNVSLNSCSNAGAVNAPASAGGIIGQVHCQTNALNNTVTLTGCTNTEAVTATKTNYAGGLVGYCSITANSGANNDLSVNGANSGDVTATTNYAGGMVGYVYILGTDNDITVSGVDGDENTGDIKAAAYAGGIVGGFYNNGGTNSTVSISTLSNNGNVTALTGDYAGGIVGRLLIYNGTGTVNLTNCSSGADKVITVNSKYVGGIVGSVEITADSAETAAYDVNVTVDGAENYSAVKSGDTAGERLGGIAGAVILRDKQDCTVTVKNSANYADFGTAAEPYAQKNFGGIIGYTIIQVRAAGIEATGNTVTLDSCTNTGNMYSSASNSNIGGILGAAVYASNTTVDGTVYDATPDNPLGTLKDNEIKLINCTNGAEGEDSGIISSTGSKVGGIAGYLLARDYISENTFTFEGCKNYGAAGAKAEAGGIAGLYHAQYYTDGITAAFTSCENHGAVKTTGNYAGGILGNYNIEGNTAFDAAYNTKNTEANFTSCKNSVSVESGAYGAAGIVGYVTVKTGGSGNELNISGTTENSGAVKANVGAGGIVGYVIIDTMATTGFAADIANCSNSGAVNATTQYAGGILGYFNVNYANVEGVSLAVSGCNNKAQIGDNTTKTTRVGGIVGYIGFSNKDAKNCSASITECENSAPVMANSEIGGIVGRIDSLAPYNAETSAPTLEIYRCRNTADADITVANNSNAYPESRAGGIIGIYYQQTTTGYFNTLVSECLNEGDITGTGQQIGGIAGFFTTKLASKDKIINCLNTGSIKTTTSQATVGGIVGQGNYSSAGKAFTIENCYNAGAVNASSGDGVIGQAPSGLTCTNVFCDPAVDSEPNAGSATTKTAAFTDHFKSVTEDSEYIWVYSDKRDLLELRYFHVKDANHSDTYVVAALNGGYALVCESINCGDVKENLSDVSNIVYVDAANGSTASDEEELAKLGTEANPCKDLDLARARVELFKDIFSEQTIMVVGEVSVPTEYHLPGIAHLTVKGGTLYFVNDSLFYKSHHIHLDGPTTIENIAIKASDTDGVRIYADNNKLVLGDGISMVGPEGNNYAVKDYWGDENIDHNSTVGAKVYVIGGYSVNEYIHENLTADEIAELDALCISFNEYVSGETVDSEYIKTNFVDKLAELAPAVAEINSDITVRSGQYRAINGWSSDFNYKNVIDAEGIVYSVPLNGTANVTVGAGEGQTLEVTHLSPFGTDYQSYGYPCVANVTVDGDVTLYLFNLGAQNASMKDRVEGIGETVVGESKYPLVVNLHLDGNIKGTEDVIDTNLWGFNVEGKVDYAILANITLNKEETEAVKDAHAFLGHDSSYCELADCTAAAATVYTNYANRSIILLDMCDGSCGGSTEYGDELYPTCITYGLKRKVCSVCGNLAELELVEQLDSEYHVYTASLTSIASLAAVENGVQLGDESATCKCGDTRDAVLVSDGIFYVSEENGYDKYVSGLGSKEKPFKDFLTAYRFATVFAEGAGDSYYGGREATVKILDKGTWTLGAGASAPSRQFLAGVHQPGHITITSEDGTGTLHLDNLSTAQRTGISFTTAVTMEKMKITLSNYTYTNPNTDASAPSRIMLFARDNALVMGEGLDIAVAEGETNPLNYNFMVFGGYWTDPEISSRDPERVDMYTDVTVLSGNYYYIGAWNYNATASNGKDGIVNGTGKITIGDPDGDNEDVITTYFLSLYGVGAETTIDTVSDLYVYGNINVTTLEPAAQNGIAKGAGGSTAPAHANNRVSNIYVYKNADFNVDNVHINGEQLVGDYTVNVFVEDSANNNSIDTVHMICGHDKGVTNGEGTTNYRHINTFHSICTDENCQYGQSDVNSYLFNTGSGNGEDCYISVNVYDMDKGEPNDIVYSISTISTTDSGAYYSDNIKRDDKEPMGGVIRFLFALDATSESCPDLDIEYGNDLIDKSYVLYLFNGTSVEDNSAATSAVGNAGYFYADLYGIPAYDETVYYAAGVVTLKDGTSVKAIKEATVDWTKAVKNTYEVVEGGVD